MIVICMAYHDRKNQLMNTLASFAGYEDIEVIIVNDCEKLGLRGGDYGFDITEITIIEKYWINAGINFNIGFEYAISLNPEAVIIQNPECYHVGDIVGNVKKRLNDKNYLSSILFVKNPNSQNPKVFSITNNELLKYINHNYENNKYCVGGHHPVTLLSVRVFPGGKMDAPV